VRIAVVEPRASGGLLHYAHQISDALSVEGAEVTLLTSPGWELASVPRNFAVETPLRHWPLNVGGGRAPGTRAGRGVQRIGKIFRRGWRAGRLVRDWTVLMRVLRPERFDVVQLGIIEFPFEAVFLKLLRRRGMVLGQVCHEFERREVRGTGERLLRRLRSPIHTAFDAVFVLGDALRRRFTELYPVEQHRVHAIPHGNESLFRHIPPGCTAAELRRRLGVGDRPVVLFFGTISASKGIEDLLDAFGQVRDATGAVLVIAGFPAKSVSRTAIDARIGQLGLAGDVVLDARYVPIDEVAPLMEMSRVVVLPYRSATQSGALQVAYALGRPVIATTVGGLPEVVQEGRTGRLVPPRDPAALAEAITSVLADGSLADKMGRHAKEMSDTTFAWQPIARTLLSIYRDEIASARREPTRVIGHDRARAPGTENAGGTTARNAPSGMASSRNAK
jgi:glycosyltransferase involved in cell wall biosynthesis